MSCFSPTDYSKWKLLPAQEFCDGVISDVRQFSERKWLDDDVCVVGMEVQHTGWSFLLQVVNGGRMAEPVLETAAANELGQLRHKMFCLLPGKTIEMRL